MFNFTTFDFTGARAVVRGSSISAARSLLFAAVGVKLCIPVEEIKHELRVRVWTDKVNHITSGRSDDKDKDKDDDGDGDGNSDSDAGAKKKASGDNDGDDDDDDEDDDSDDEEKKLPRLAQLYALMSEGTELCVGV
jgi:hypothetical protein